MWSHIFIHTRIMSMFKCTMWAMISLFGYDRCCGRKYSTVNSFRGWWLTTPSWFIYIGSFITICHVKASYVLGMPKDCQTLITIQSGIELIKQHSCIRVVLGCFGGNILHMSTKIANLIMKDIWDWTRLKLSLEFQWLLHVVWKYVNRDVNFCDYTSQWMSFSHETGLILHGHG